MPGGESTPECSQTKKNYSNKTCATSYHHKKCCPSLHQQFNARYFYELHARLLWYNGGKLLLEYTFYALFIQTREPFVSHFFPRWTPCLVSFLCAMYANVFILPHILSISDKTKTTFFHRHRDDAMAFKQPMSCLIIWSSNTNQCSHLHYSLSLLGAMVVGN